MVRVPGEDLFNAHEQRITALEQGGGGGEPVPVGVGTWEVLTTPPGWVEHFNEQDLAALTASGVITFGVEPSPLQVRHHLGGYLAIPGGGGDVRVLAPELQMFALELEARVLIRGELPPLLKLGVIGVDGSGNEGPGAFLDGVTEGAGGWSPLDYPPLDEWHTIRVRLGADRVSAWRTDGRYTYRNMGGSWRAAHPGGAPVGLRVQPGGAGQVVVDYVMCRPLFTEPDRGLASYDYNVG